MPAKKESGVNINTLLLVVLIPALCYFLKNLADDSRATHDAVIGLVVVSTNHESRIQNLEEAEKTAIHRQEFNNFRAEFGMPHDRGTN